MSTVDLSALSHRARRAYLKKTKRKRIRQALARARDEAEAAEYARLQSSPSYAERLQIEEEQLRLEKEQRDLDEQAWLERERIAQEAWQAEQMKKQAAQKMAEEVQLHIRTERIQAQRPDSTATSESVPVVHKSQPTDVENDTHLPLWHHPPLPDNLAQPARAVSSTGPPKELCSFFRKTGACRYGSSCSRRHDYPQRNDPVSADEVDETDLVAERNSRLVLRIADMFVPYQFRVPSSPGQDAEHSDSGLEADEAQLLNDYADFYRDVHEELETRWGRIAALRTCRNRTEHLRGAVYVEFALGSGAAWDAAEACHGRWFAGRQLSCTVVRLGGGWREAICGLYHRGRCPKGDQDCNFLHVLLNPGETVFDLHRALREERGELQPAERLNRSRQGRHQHSPSANRSSPLRSRWRYPDRMRRYGRRSMRSHSRSPSSASSTSLSPQPRSRRRHNSQSHTDTAGPSAAKQSRHHRHHHHKHHRHVHRRRRREPSSRSTSPSSPEIAAHQNKSHRRKR